MRSRWLPVLEVAAVAGFFALLGFIALRMGRGLTGWAQAPFVALAAAAGYAMADVASGLTHWFCDTFFEEDTPGIGPALIHPFREHHRDPSAMTRHGFLELVGNSCLGVIPVLGVCLWRPWSPIFDAGLIVFAMALFGTNLFHKWAHSENVPAAVRWLQRCRLILNPVHHGIHHTPPNKSAYGVTNGWMNAILDRILS